MASIPAARGRRTLSWEVGLNGSRIRLVGGDEGGGIVRVVDEDQWQRVLGALEAARTGSPTVLLFTGDAGMGKSTLLDQVTAETGADFRVLSADAVEGAAAPFTVLEQWGVIPPSPEGWQTSPFVAAQWLRNRIDESGGQPVMLRLDDLHWADPESVEAIGWLMRRVDGDRLLLGIGTRPLGDDVHPGWQRWQRTAGNVVECSLKGISRTTADALILKSQPTLAPGIAGSLWAHTGGNPLYLTALLREFDAAEFSSASVLPAPRAYASAVISQLRRLPAESVLVTQACAVLGTTWIPLGQLAQLTGVHNPAAAVQPAIDAGLLEIRMGRGLMSIRTTHALTRSAIYQNLPLDRRAALHAVASQIVADPGEALGHRLNAAVGPDDQLADDLDQYAKTLATQQSYRLAGEYLRWSAMVTSDQQVSLDRRLRACFESVVAHDHAVVRQELAELRKVAGSAAIALLEGAADVLAGRWIEGAHALAPLVGEPLRAGESALDRYRAEALLAWAQMGSGASTELVLNGVERAAALGVIDFAVLPFLMYAGGVAQARQIGTEASVHQLEDLPETPTDVPLEMTPALGMRAGCRIHMGMVVEGAADIAETFRRSEITGMPILNAGFRGELGLAQWFNGRWELAQVNLRLATEISDGLILPLAWYPLAPIGTGDFDTADRYIAAATRKLTGTPFREAIQALFLAEVVRLHAGGTDDQRRQLMPRYQDLWPDTQLFSGFASALHRVHGAQAAIWTGDLKEAEHHAQVMSKLSPRADWLPSAVDWIRGLVAQARGDLPTALACLQAATTTATATMPLYRAHMHADRAAVAELLQRTQEAAASFVAARDVYLRLGATPYLNRPAPEGQGILAAAEAGRDEGSRREDRRSAVLDTLGLSRREQEVAQLLSAGYSYRQIAADLFITQGTVNFHASNIYAKANVRTRHQFAQLLRVHRPAPSGS